MNPTTTPLMKQYFAIKEQYNDTLLLFQVGDFYELFFDDAKKAAAFLGITLTKRGKSNGEPIPLCGVPVHALDYYLIKLIKGGFRVAICSQLEEAKPGKVVDRGVTQVLTPGTLTDIKLLDEKSSSYLLSFYPTAHAWTLLFSELLTAQLISTIIPRDSEKILENELARFLPDEILLPDTKEGKRFGALCNKRGFCITYCQPYDEQEAESWIEKQFNAVTDKEKLYQVHGALSQLYHYLARNQALSLHQFKQVLFYEPNDFLIIDSATQKNLELIHNNQDGSRTNTLFAHLDRAATPMGSRTLKKWLTRPLIQQQMIQQRQGIVSLFCERVSLMERVKELLHQIGDIERVVGRIALDRAHVHDYILLSSALRQTYFLVEILREYTQHSLMVMICSLHNQFEALAQLLQASLDEEAQNDHLIKTGFDQTLDHMRTVLAESSQLLLSLEQEEIKKTGINSLKVRYNQVHGYYIEITKANVHLVPDHYIRHQTLVGKERYTTLALKQLESEIMQAQHDVERVEQEVFSRVKREVYGHVADLRRLAQACAHLDGLLAFALVSHEYGYVKPTFNDHTLLMLQAGRHPVVEARLDHRFISNDTMLNQSNRLHIITGPNMGGKSTYLRQIALCSIMAQCGCFVPAQKADLPILDRVFTRIGAGDNVAEGKSTFLVEMEETAHICRFATSSSLVILDEVGRGTSTVDGLAIAQAVVEYLYEQVQALCLFATHYHELTHLQEHFSGIKSFYAASKKTENGILFLYKILQGVADGSFGIEVARLADVPATIVQRARSLVKIHEKTSTYSDSILPAQKHNQNSDDNMDHQVLQEAESYRALSSYLKSYDFEQLSPKEAFDLLWQLKQNFVVDS